MYSHLLQRAVGLHRCRLGVVRHVQPESDSASEHQVGSDLTPREVRETLGRVSLLGELWGRDGGRGREGD